MRPIITGGWARRALFASSLFLVGACWIWVVSAISSGIGPDTGDAAENARRKNLGLAVSFISGVIFGPIVTFFLSRFLFGHRPPEPQTVSVSARLPSDVEVAERLSRAVTRLSSSGLLITWHLRHEDGRPLVDAMITNARSTANTTLAGDDLRSEPAVRYKLLDAWSEVLKAESHRVIGESTGPGERLRP